MKTVTSEMVVGLWDHLEEVYQSRHVSKCGAAEMKLIGRALDQMGIVDQERFMRHYTTTITDIVYTPFLVGVESDDWPLSTQLHIGGHEHKHVKQWREGRETFVVEYLSDPARRAHYEARAMTVNLEIGHWLGEPERDVFDWVEKLVDYAIGEEDRATVRKQLELVSTMTRKGAIVTDVGRISIAWLDGYLAARSR